MSANEYKVFFVYKDQSGLFNEESVWASKQGDNYRIENIPFFACNIAYGDVVSVEEDDGRLYFNELISASGHSVVHVVLFDRKYLDELVRLVESSGCSWEGAHVDRYISIDVPKSVDYLSMKRLLEEGVRSGKWDYKEACLSDSHSY